MTRAAMVVRIVLPFVLAAIALFVLAFTLLLRPGPAAATAAPIERVVAVEPSVPSSCQGYIPGDLIGNANPAELYRGLCLDR